MPVRQCFIAGSQDRRVHVVEEAFDVPGYGIIGHLEPVPVAVCEAEHGLSWRLRVDFDPVGAVDETDDIMKAVARSREVGEQSLRPDRRAPAGTVTNRGEWWKGRH